MEKIVGSIAAHNNKVPCTTAVLVILPLTTNISCSELLKWTVEGLAQLTTAPCM